MSQTDADGTLGVTYSEGNIQIAFHGRLYSLLADEAGSIVAILDENGSGQWYYGGQKIYNVCIPGSAMLETVDGSGIKSMKYYYNQHYNIFFGYSK